VAPTAPVIIHPYNPLWPRIYEEEKSVLEMTAGQLLLSIEHIGSTSVPGLQSKDIVDILAGVADSKAADECQRLLLGAGYDDVTPEDHPEWFYCLGKRLESACFHLHIVKEGSLHQRNHTIFRDWLTEHDEDAAAYAELKMRLAEKHKYERRRYTDAKAGFIAEILEKAKGEPGKRE